MIQANELRIGNLVGFYKSKLHDLQVGEVDGVELDYEDLEYKIRIPKFSRIPLTEAGIKPIPLTEEWLDKFGQLKGKFTLRYAGDDNDEEYDLGFNLDEYYLYEGIDAMCNIINWHPIKYVHQLQNLYFALTGEELTIKE